MGREGRMVAATAVMPDKDMTFIRDQAPRMLVTVYAASDYARALIAASTGHEREG